MELEWAGHLMNPAVFWGKLLWVSIAQSQSVVSNYCGSVLHRASQWCLTTVGQYCTEPGVWLLWASISQSQCLDSLLPSATDWHIWRPTSSLISPLSLYLPLSICLSCSPSSGVFSWSISISFRWTVWTWCIISKLLTAAEAEPRPRRLGDQERWQTQWQRDEERTQRCVQNSKQRQRFADIY